MNAFIICNTTSGHVLGVYGGDTAEDAHLAMALDAGYDSVQDMNETTGDDGSDLQIDALAGSYAVHETFREHTAGSEGFAAQIDTVGGYDMSREEIRRIGLAVAELHEDDAELAEAFHTMWEGERWWLDARRDEPTGSDINDALREGDADVLAQHTIAGALDNLDVGDDYDEDDAGETDAMAVRKWWSDKSDAASVASEMVGVYCDVDVYQDEESPIERLSDDVMDAVTARVAGWVAVACRADTAAA